MTIELSVLYDGDEPGLSEHRLSLASFGEPMKLLLLALQRTASAIIVSAADDPEYGSRGGKLAKEATLLDLELGVIGEGCARPSFTLAIRPDPKATHRRTELDKLAADAVEKLVRDIDAESKGTAQSYSARAYLKALPPGVTRQAYRAWRDETILAHAEFDVATLREPPTEVPRLMRTIGQIVAVGFDPGSTFVSLQVGDRVQKLAATAESIEQAIALRGKTVVAAALLGKEPRLLSIRSSDAPARAVTMAETIEHLETRWGRTLTVLAQ